MLLSPVTFQNLDNTTEDADIMGFIAQDVEPIVKDLVIENDEGIKRLSTTSFGIIAIKGIQEQQLLIEDNDQKISNLLEENMDLKNRVAQLEAIMTKILAEK